MAELAFPRTTIVAGLLIIPSINVHTTRLEDRHHECRIDPEPDKSRGQP
jgi:hypothetical protein